VEAVAPAVLMASHHLLVLQVVQVHLAVLAAEVLREQIRTPHLKAVLAVLAVDGVLPVQLEALRHYCQLQAQVLVEQQDFVQQVVEILHGLLPEIDLDHSDDD
jgi:hypothetical protein